MSLELQNIRQHKIAHILQFSIPSIIGMLLTSLVAINDGFFTGNYVGPDGLAAINLGLPILYFYLAIGLVFGVGGSTIAGLSLGAKDTTKANNAFMQSIASSIVSTVLFSVIVSLLFNPILFILKVPENACALFKTYYSVMLFTYPLMVLTSNLGIFIRADGKPQFTMLISVLNIVLNILLNYIFAAKLKSGIFGIAIASLITQIILTLLCLIYFIKLSSVYKLGKFMFDRNDNKNMMLNGGSEFIGETASCISMFCFNFVIMKYVGLDGIAAFTVVGYTLFFYNMIVIGFGQGLCPLVSFCAGAKDLYTCISLRRLVNAIVFACGVVFTIIIVLCRNQFGAIFVHDKKIILMISKGLLIFAPEFILMGINVIASMYFTALGKAKESALISSLRGLIILLILTFIFPAFFGITGVWIISPLTEALTMIVTVMFLHKSIDK